MVKNLVTGAIINDTSDVLISARGNLNNPAWPAIDGFNEFKGEVMHSARWNQRYDVRQQFNSQLLKLQEGTFTDTKSTATISSKNASQ
jgi:hypothetical protein